MSTTPPDYESLRIKAAQEGVEAVAKQLFCGADSSTFTFRLGIYPWETTHSSTNINGTPKERAEAQAIKEVDFQGLVAGEFLIESNDWPSGDGGCFTARAVGDKARAMRSRYVVKGGRLFLKAK